MGAVGKKLGRESGKFSSEVDFNSLVILDSENVLVIGCAPWRACAPDDRRTTPSVFGTVKEFFTVGNKLGSAQHSTAQRLSCCLRESVPRRKVSDLKQSRGL